MEMVSKVHAQALLTASLAFCHRAENAATIAALVMDADTLEHATIILDLFKGVASAGEYMLLAAPLP